MSTFNLNEMIKSGKLNIKVATCHCKQDIIEEQPQEIPMTECPQCDGKGKEDHISGCPSVCRRCAGAGSIIKKLIMAADVEIPNTPSDDITLEDNEDAPSESSPSDAINYEGVTDGDIPSNDWMSDAELKDEIQSLIMSKDHRVRLLIFDGLCEIIKTQAEEKIKKSTGLDGKPDANAVTAFLYETLDTMNTQQLRALDSKIKEIIWG